MNRCETVTGPRLSDQAETHVHSDEMLNDWSAWLAAEVDGKLHPEEEQQEEEEEEVEVDVNVEEDMEMEEEMEEEEEDDVEEVAWMPSHLPPPPPVPKKRKKADRIG